MNALTLQTTPQIDNIYSRKAEFYIAAVSLDWVFPVFFDGLSWTREVNAAKKFLTIGSAARVTEIESPTPHAPEIWRLDPKGLQLVAGEGCPRIRSRPNFFPMEALV